ncbi:hypothetical protein [Stenotrophomonas oahuensis]|uniref:Transmembrane protein n=1 Tax=Stenotrophomonas oahuensis TaxID=3003271 RepID=A0ABY9YLZ1_9GAMM|nr:hypothetical protein [Stenotrophomonas sp. A5586]WNH51284.1 hypothetical protein PDM29_13020 [Stenotrophomonas sp. A5586]
MDSDPVYLHIRVVLSIILGLSITTLLRGLAQIIENPARRGCSWLHIAWVLWALISVVTFWWWEFRLIQVHRWTFGLYLFVLAYCASWYLLCVLLFPDDLRDYDSYEHYLLQRRGGFFGMLALVTLLDLGDTAIKGHSRWVMLGEAYPIHTAAMLAVAALGMISRSRRVHVGLATAALLYQCGYFLAEYFSLSAD